jgi:hypothetical protein
MLACDFHSSEYMDQGARLDALMLKDEAYWISLIAYAHP